MSVDSAISLDKKKDEIYNSRRAISLVIGKIFETPGGHFAAAQGNKTLLARIPLEIESP